MDVLVGKHCKSYVALTVGTRERPMYEQRLYDVSFRLKRKGKINYN